MSKVFQSYPGGKGGTGVHQTIINEIPPHSVYAELFLGNGTIFQFIKKPDVVILADLSRFVIHEWKKTGIELIEDFDLFNVFFKNPKRPVLIHKCAIELLRQRNTSGFPTLGDTNFELDRPDTFIFLDPPYPFEVRKDQQPIYEHEMTDEDHIALLEVVKSYKNANIMLSSYPNDIYNDALLPTWRKLDFKGQTRKGKVTERIYMNYPDPEELQDYRYIGENYRDRWRIEKSTRNVIAKLQRMSAKERNAVLFAIGSAFS